MKAAKILLPPIVVFTLILVLPLPRQVGLAFRYDFSWLFALLCVLFWVAFRLPDFLQPAASLSLAALLFALPVSGLWASGQSEPQLLGGIIPFSDAVSYFADARNMLEGMASGSFLASRPLFSAYLGVILSLSGQNLQIAIAVMTFLAMISAWLVARELNCSFGPVAAALSLLVLFFFFRSLSGKTMTENLGFTLGCLGFAFLWRAIDRKKISAWWVGLFLISLALNARAGALFILPVLIIWGSLHFSENIKRGLLKFLVFGTGAVGLAFVVNLLIFKIFVPQGLPFSNFSYVLYGLATGGKGWQQIYVYQPQVFALPAEQQSPQIMQYALENIRRKPENLLTGAGVAWSMFFGLDDYSSAFCFLGGDTGWIGAITRFVFFLFALIPLGYWARNKRDVRLSFLFFMTVGILLSVPFAPPIDSNRMRAYAATIPVFAVLPAVGAALILNRLPLFKIETKTEVQTSNWMLPAISAIVLLASLAGPIILRLFPPKSKFSEISCNPDQISIYTRFNPGSSIRLVEQNVEMVEKMPVVGIKSFIRYAHNLPQKELYPFFDSMQSGTTLFNDIDIKTGEAVLVISPTDLLPASYGAVGICGKEEELDLRLNRIIKVEKITRVGN